MRSYVASRQASANIEQTKAMTKLLEAELPEKEAAASFWKKYPSMKFWQYALQGVGGAARLSQEIIRR